jgi:predicted metalloprotease
MGGPDGRRSDKLDAERGNRIRTGLKLALVSSVALVAAYFLGVDPRVLLGLVDSPPPPGAPVIAAAPPVASPQDTVGEFVSVVLSDTEDTWTQIFAEDGETYIPPRLRYFDGSTRSGCGKALAESGTFYCPADRRVYIDLNFYRELAERSHTPGDLAQAYVIAHEVGHHVQNLMGTEMKLRKAQAGKSLIVRNTLQLRSELQADCYAGIWAHNTERSRVALDPDSLEAAFAAVESVGADMIQRQAQDEIVPDSFTHGTSAQRQRWFESGLKRGLVKDCDTYSARRL